MLLGFVTHRALPQLSDDDRLAVGELRSHGVSVESAVWDSPLVDWARYDALVLRSPRDHHRRQSEFEGWLAHVERVGVPLWNPAGLVRWNLDRRYLLDLEERGVSIVPTRVVERGDPVTLAAIADDAGWDDIVFEPSVGTPGTRRVLAAPSDRASREADFAALLAEHDVLVQPSVAAHDGAAWWSLLFFGGQYSHAVRRRSGARPPDVAPARAEQAGAAWRDDTSAAVAESPRGALVARGEAIVAHLPGPWLFARVDGIEREGELLLTALELVDPDLFLGHHPSAPRRFASTLRHLVAGHRVPLPFTPRSVTPPHGAPG